MYNHLVEKLAGKIDRTRSDVKKIAASLPHQTPGPVPVQQTSRTPTPLSPQRKEAIPLSPRREDYPLVKHWTPEAWQAIRHPKKGSTIPKPTTPSSSQENDSILSLFCEDEFGRTISDTRWKAANASIQVFWQGKHENGVVLRSLTNVGWDLRKEF